MQIGLFLAATDRAKTGCGSRFVRTTSYANYGPASYPSLRKLLRFRLGAQKTLHTPLGAWMDWTLKVYKPGRRSSLRRFCMPTHSQIDDAFDEEGILPPSGEREDQLQSVFGRRRRAVNLKDRALSRVET